jgi:hypothetical protein
MQDTKVIKATLALAVLYFLILCRNSPGAGVPRLLPMICEVRQQANQSDRLLVRVGTNHYCLILPEGFHLSAASTAYRLQMVSERSGISYELRISALGEGMDAADGVWRRRYLLSQFPGASIFDEAAVNTLGREGVAFDVVVPVVGASAQRARTVLIPASAGLVQLTTFAPTSEFAPARETFNRMLTTFQPISSQPASPHAPTLAVFVDAS